MTMRSASAVRALEEALRPRPRLVKRECRVCGAWHSGPHSGCKTCLGIESAQKLVWRSGQKAAGLCQTCVDKTGRGSVSRCAHHLEYVREYNAEQYRDQRAKGLCGWARCPVASVGCFCDKHRARANERVRRRSARGPHRAWRRA